jgi:hypothetical protein
MQSEIRKTEEDYPRRGTKGHEEEEFEILDSKVGFSQLFSSHFLPDPW